MSTAKRSRQRQAEAHSASAPPASKRLKSSHVPAKPTSTLDFLVDEDNRAGKRLDAKLTNGVPRSNANRVNESHAAIAAQPSDSSEEESDESEDEAQQHRPVKKPQADVISISSAEESSVLEEDEIDEGKPTLNGHGTSGDAQAVAGAGDVEMEDTEPTEEPTFGDLLQARHPDPIDVQKSLQTAEAKGHHSLVPAGSRQAVQAPSGGSLGTVLTQALKTNDKDLLESCFAQVDVNVIRSTIQRQQSTHIATLLERIAERIHKRPGRAGRLMIWIQWSLVLHGGYLANQPELMKKLKALAQVTRERANGLQPLLHLKGKLDFLGAQLEARRSMQVASRAGNADEEDDEEGVLYIEGQEQVWSSDDEAEEHQAVGKRSRAKELPQVAEEQSDAEAGDADLPNGFINGVEDDSSADEDDDGRNGIIDDEAEEASGDEDQSSNDEADSDATSVDDDDDSEVDESESEAVKQPKPQHLHRKR